jgi:FKBP-type peptidyl-prolyl cis-trans isomerase SlyD
VDDNLKPAVSDGMVVTVDYTVRLDDGQVADTTQGAVPLRFLVGEGQVLPGFEDSIVGMIAGEEKSFELAPEDAYGEFDEEAFEEVPIDAFPTSQTLEEGMSVGVTDSEGDTYEALVHEVRSDAVVLNYNHPMAGERLHFTVKVLDIRAATPSELEHGHAHSADEHPH